MDFVFRSTGDDNFEPGGMCGRLVQSLQEDWAILIVTALVECVDDKDQRVLWLAREVADEVEEERVLHRL